MTTKIQEFPMLQDMDPNDLGKLITYMTWESFEKGKDILNEGEFGSQMYFLIDGSVDVIKRDLNGDEYLCATLSAEMKCVFGEMSVLDGEKRSATIRTREKCLTLKLSSDAFLRFCKENPSSGVQLLLYVANSMSRNLRNENEKLMDLYMHLADTMQM